MKKRAREDKPDVLTTDVVHASYAGTSIHTTREKPMTQAGRTDATVRAGHKALQANLLRALANRVVAQATGTDLPESVRLFVEDPENRDPRKRLWLGMLESEPLLIGQAGADPRDRILPAAQGFTFRTKRRPAQLAFRLTCAFYVALHPTRAEQIESIHDDPGRLDPTSRVGHQPAFVWTKLRPEPIDLSIDIDPADPRVRSVGQHEIEEALRRAHRLPPGSEYFRPLRRRSPTGSNPRESDLVDERTWRSYCAHNLTPADEILPPAHSARIQVEVTPRGDDQEILITIVNTTQPHGAQLIDGERGYDKGRIDPRLYEVVLSANTDATLVPYELEQVAGAHRYDRHVQAFGHACPVLIDQRDGAVTLRTQYAAFEPTGRVYPRDQIQEATGRLRKLDTSFDSLIADPIRTATELVDAFQGWVSGEWSRENLDRLAGQKNWDHKAREDAETDARKAHQEVEWIRAGVELLRTDDNVRDAFIAANQTMKNSASDRFEAWHPFQVAWILGCLAGMVDPEQAPEVNIVWFATGGGKSEAYLGLMLTTMFYGRYTGTTAGSQVWARFPLRLLALQQMERFAKAVLHAELVRRSDHRINRGGAFGIGYFVGSGNTPNKLYDSKSPYYRGADPYSTDTAERCRVLKDCPICDEHLEMQFDAQSWTMWHVCTNGNCDLNGKLPVWSVDDDVYRHAPTVLVGTVDRLAALGMGKQFQILLGRPHSRCPRHGYRADPNWCEVYGCQEREQPVPKGFGHIRLEIADELHLLDESLGALDGMYETLLQAISERLGNPPMQIVGATATIEGYKNQVSHLYKRTARRFPENGPEAGHTFWSYTMAPDDDPLRLYVGVRPRVGTMVTATTEVTQQHRKWAEELRDRPEAILAEAGLDPSDPASLTEARRAGRDLYEVLVAYCLRNEDLNNFTNDKKVKEGIQSEHNLAYISGDVEPDRMRGSVERLKNPPDDDKARVKIIAATKAIGHGFDVDRLGVMAIMGTPTQAAEIIQASARVGRKHPGLVINIANPTRDRDASVFRYYREWVRYLDRMVHKVPVNRESLPVLRRVLSGGLMAWLLQVRDRAWITGGKKRRSLRDSTAFSDALADGALSRDELIDDLQKGFGIDGKSDYHAEHRHAIERWVDDQIATLPLRAGANRSLPELLYPSVPTSLRDVQEPITIHGEL